MRPFEKDSQLVVTKGRRKTKLAAPKSKSAAALTKRKTRNIRKKENNDGTDNLSKEACQFVPVRRKPLGEYITLELPMMTSPPSSSTQGMRMSYAAAVETGSGVNIMISPRFNKTSSTSNKSGNKGKTNKVTSDTKFRIFNEQPKPHIVCVDPKKYRADVERKIKCPIPPQMANKSLPKTDPNDVDIKALKLQFKRLECNAASTATVAIKGNSLSASSSEQANRRQVNRVLPEYADSVSYLRFHHKRLQRIIKEQSTWAIPFQPPEPMKLPQFEDKHFQYLEEAALLAQNRTMLRLWTNSDQLIC